MVSEATPLVDSVQTRSIDDGNCVSVASTDESLVALRKARRLLYTSHFFAQFSQQSWEFGLTLFLAAITGYNNLILVASYGIVTGLVVFTTGSSAGRYFVDNSNWNRISSAQFLIWTQNGCVILATALSYALLLSKKRQLHPTEMDNNDDASSNWKRDILVGIPLDYFSIMLIIGLHIFGPMSTVLDKAFLVSIERDWVVVMGEYARNLKQQESKKSETWLYETNVFMKQIDLTCRIAAPAFAGFAIGMTESYGLRNKSYSLAVTALLIGLLNGAALFVEYICTARIYQLIPTLAIKHPQVRISVTTTSAEIKNSNDIVSDSENDDAVVPHPTLLKRFTLLLPVGLRVYFSQPISLAGVSIALLYFNTLTFGSLMTAYLLWRGMSLQSVGLWRGVSSALGLAGTFAFRISTKKLSLVSTGMWSILYQLFCVTASTASFFFAAYNVSMSLLIFGVCASRIGLWVFDIAVTQLMQEFVPEGIRGAVGGTQHALNAFFQLSAFGLGFVFPSPKEFNILAFAGCISVMIAAVIYSTSVFFCKEMFVTSIERSSNL